MRNVLTGAVVLLTLTVCSAASADGFWYLGAGVGYQESGISRSRLSEPLPSCRGVTLTTAFADCVVTEDDGGGSYSIFAGYQATRYLAIELAYADLGTTFDVSVVDPRFPPPVQIDGEQESTAFTVRGVLTLPLSQLSQHDALKPVSVSGVLGMTHWRSDATYRQDVTGGNPASTPVRLSDSDSGNDLMLGARVNYDVTEQVRLMGTWDHYTDLGKGSAMATGTANTPPTTAGAVRGSVNVFSVGVSYRFH